MVRVQDGLVLDGVPIVRLESDFLRVDVAPTIGGRIVSLTEKAGGFDFLWKNRRVGLRELPAGAEYDPHFYGGIDELLPNDAPETIAGIACPDHGELWTTPLTAALEGAAVKLRGNLARFGLRYERTMTLRPDQPRLDCAYRITNLTSEPRPFLWKLHAALPLEGAEIIDCPARTARAVDLAWSRSKSLEPFAWPDGDHRSPQIMPVPDGGIDFLYLYDLKEGRIGWRRPRNGLHFTYRFDPAVFRCAWLFASAGGFDGHHTAVLEPCTAMPMSVNEADALGHCSRLAPGGVLETVVTVQAGRD